MSCVAAIDQGTTSSRVIIFDHSGAILGLHQLEHKQIYPAPALVEHDVEEIYRNVVTCCTNALKAAGKKPSDLASVGITNQRETIVVWDRRTGKPYHNALVWQDQRGAPLCEKLSAEGARDGGQDRLRKKTGLPIVPYFSASKLTWLLENVPGLRADALAGHALAGTIDTYLVWRLTEGAVFATDVSNASRTLLCNIFSTPTASWDPELCSLFNVPMQMLPTIRPSVYKYGPCAGSSPLPGVMIGGILGDQQAALFGQTCFEKGEAKSTYGTGCFLLLNTGDAPVQSSQGLLTTIAFQLGEDSKPFFALEGSVAVGGAVVTWLRDNMKLVEGAHSVEAQARSEEDSGGVVFVPAFNGLFAPYWRSDARGLLLGLSGFTKSAHVVRAALESVALQNKDLLDAMGRDAINSGVISGDDWRKAALRVDGGMTANGLLMQFQADVLRRRVVRPKVAETTSLGAAYAAGLAVGFWTNLEELRRQWQVEKTWDCGMSAEKALHKVERWHEAVSRAVNWAKTEGSPLIEDDEQAEEEKQDRVGVAPLHIRASSGSSSAGSSSAAERRRKREADAEAAIFASTPKLPLPSHGNGNGRPHSPAIFGDVRPSQALVFVALGLVLGLCAKDVIAHASSRKR